jgi:hypothetical protein
LEIQCERDCIEGRLVLSSSYRDGQSPSLRRPAQVEERTALALDCDGVRDEIDIYALIEVRDEAARRPLDQASVFARLAVAP